MEVIELADDDEDDDEYIRPMEQAARGADDEFTAAGFGINDAEEGDTDPLHWTAPRMAGDVPKVILTTAWANKPAAGPESSVNWEGAS